MHTLLAIPIFLSCLFIMIQFYGLANKIMNDIINFIIIKFKMESTNKDTSSLPDDVKTLREEIKKSIYKFTSKTGIYPEIKIENWAQINGHENVSTRTEIEINIPL